MKFFRESQVEIKIGAAFGRVIALSPVQTIREEHRAGLCRGVKFRETNSQLFH